MDEQKNAMLLEKKKVESSRLLARVGFFFLFGENCSWILSLFCSYLTFDEGILLTKSVRARLI